LFPVTLPKPVNGGGRELAVAVKLANDMLVSLNGSLEIVVGFLFEQTLLQSRRHAVCGGGTGPKQCSD
jgi:hypothetical protein